MQKVNDSIQGAALAIEITKNKPHKNSGAVIHKAKSRMIKKSYMSIEKYATQGV